MTTKNGTVDFEYKEGVSDTVGVVLKQNGAAIDLRDYSIVFNIKDNSNHRFSVPCSLGSTVNGVEYTAEHGGCTIEFAAEHLSTVGEFNGEFVFADGSKNSIFLNNTIRGGGGYYRRSGPPGGNHVISGNNITQSRGLALCRFTEQDVGGVLKIEGWGL